MNNRVQGYFTQDYVAKQKAKKSKTIQLIEEDMGYLARFRYQDGVVISFRTKTQLKPRHEPGLIAVSFYRTSPAGEHLTKRYVYGGEKMKTSHLPAMVTCAFSDKNVSQAYLFYTHFGSIALQYLAVDEWAPLPATVPMQQPVRKLAHVG